MTLPRRTALLDWAEAAGGWILEDDYDGEYRYRGPPLPALKSLDRHERVVYCGTFSKVLFAGLRLGYVVVPDSQIAAFTAACRRSLHGGCPELMQAVVADFIEEGHFARHIKRMRALYAKRGNLCAVPAPSVSGGPKPRDEARRLQQPARKFRRWRLPNVVDRHTLIVAMFGDQLQIGLPHIRADEFDLGGDLGADEGGQRTSRSSRSCVPCRPTANGCNQPR